MVLTYSDGVQWDQKVASGSDFGPEPSLGPGIGSAVPERSGFASGVET